jgi:hypothetical protein
MRRFAALVFLIAVARPGAGASTQAQFSIEDVLSAPFVVAPAGDGKPEAIIYAPGTRNTLRWSPDGRQIAFARIPSRNEATTRACGR